MSKKRRDIPATADAAPATTAVKPLVPLLLLSISAAEALLSLFQWMELLVLRAGGETVCGINNVLDCQKVWETGFAAGIHNRLGIPVAGLGLVWGLAAFAVSAAWAYDLLKGHHNPGRATAIKWMAAAGALSCVVFAIVSFSAGAVCLTCLATYAIVAAFALVAFMMVPGALLPGDSGAMKTAALWAVGASVVAYLALLGPGLATPHAGEATQSRMANLPDAPRAAPGDAQPPKATAQNTQAQPAQDSGAPSRPLSSSEQTALSYLKQLPLQEQTMVSTAVAMYEQGKKVEGDTPKARVQWGPEGAPVDLVEWVDIRCPHCRTLVETLQEIKRAVPEGTLSVEPRNYPLDNECNPYVSGSDKTGLRCLAAKAMICIEPTETFWETRARLFAQQSSLTQERIYEIASSGGMSRARLEQCVKDPKTAKKLEEDIQYAMKFNPQGTPLAVVNGKTALPFGPFLYSLVMARGDTGSPMFDQLPPARMDALGGGHAGHGHEGHDHGHEGHAH